MYIPLGFLVSRFEKFDIHCELQTESNGFDAVPKPSDTPSSRSFMDNMDAMEDIPIWEAAGRTASLLAVSISSKLPGHVGSTATAAPQKAQIAHIIILITPPFDFIIIILN
jgi:hypothetical protein